MFTAQVHVHRLPAAPAPHAGNCADCRNREVCIPSRVGSGDAQRIETLAFPRRRVHEGEALFHAGQPFAFAYAVRSGTFKTVMAVGDGREQVTGFALSGDIMGLEGLASGAHPGTAIALEDAEVCSVPFAELARMSQQDGAVHKMLSRLLGSAIVRQHQAMLQLGSMPADERVAGFLLDVSRRMHARGFSPTEFHLRMSRADIGSFLGTTLETVSRALSAFQRQEMIEVDRKHVRILDIGALSHVGEPVHH